jgi:hypothetical protein
MATTDLLADVPLFKRMKPKRMKVADAMTERSYASGRELTVEGAGGVGPTSGA